VRERDEPYQPMDRARKCVVAAGKEEATCKRGHQAARSRRQERLAMQPRSSSIRARVRPRKKYSLFFIQ
jgi:hypothetical protein